MDDVPKQASDRVFQYPLAVLQAVQRPEAERLVRDLLAFPAVLPDLSSLRPPGGNTRPGGISDCLCERHRRGDLPVAY